MNCPKCGFEQAERKECLKCGVIFSKYLALYPRGSRAGEAQEVHARLEEEPVFQDSSELALQVREITRKLNEIEIDRGDRARLGAEMRILEHKLTERISDIVQQVDAIEERLRTSAPAAPAADPQLQTGLADIQASIAALDLPSLVSRLEILEAAVEKPTAEKPDPGVLNNLFQIEERLRGLEVKRSAEGGTEDGEPLLDAAELPEHLEEFVEDLGRIQGSIEELEQRGAEFDRLRQTHTDILENVEAMRSDLEAMRGGGESEATEKTARLAGEVAALRGELKTLAEAAFEPKRAQEAPERENLEALEERLDRFGGEIDALRTAASGSGAGEPGRLEELSSELGRLRSALDAVTLRYSEIGELKKNNLQLSSSLEAIHRDLAGLKEGVSRGYLQRVEDVEKEVGALRAEVRQVLTRLETRASRRSS